jgi:hypothetical protein
MATRWRHARHPTTVEGRRIVRPPISNVVFGLIAVVCCVGSSGCDYDVPITPEPTRQVDARLVGNWVSAAGKDRMSVRQLDDTHYVVNFNDHLFYVHHSDVGGTAFFSAQELDSPDRRYLFLAYTLSDNGAQLTVRNVNGAISKKAKSSADVRRLLQENLKNPELFEDELLLGKEK